MGHYDSCYEYDHHEQMEKQRQDIENIRREQEYVIDEQVKRDFNKLSLEDKKFIASMIHDINEWKIFAKCLNKFSNNSLI